MNMTADLQKRCPDDVETDNRCEHGSKDIRKSSMLLTLAKYFSQITVNVRFDPHVVQNAI